MTLQEQLTAVATRTGFSGVAVVDRSGDREAEVVAGLADRAEQRAINVDTRFATASATKGFTALATASLIEDGLLSLDTPVTDITGDDLPLIDPSVTIEQLLAHTSGIGDYLDEEQLGDIDDHVLGVSAHELEGPEDYLPLLGGHAQVFQPGTRFAYNNSGFVILALVNERVGRAGYHRLVEERVFRPAGMDSSGFFRSDDLPAGTALGYLENGRTNVFHLPVVGTGDGGAHTTVGDMTRFWGALFEARIVDPVMVAAMTRAHDHPTSEPRRYGLGFWVANDGTTATLLGMDAGVSFLSSHRPHDNLTLTVASNSSSGVWPLVELLEAELGAA